MVLKEISTLLLLVLCQRNPDLINLSNLKQKTAPGYRNGLYDCLPLNSYFLAEVSIFAAVSIFAVVSTMAGAVVVVSGATVDVLSLVVELSLLLLQATKAVAKIAIARSFFI